jgi:Domain of unknown function (DUF4249)
MNMMQKKYTICDFNLFQFVFWGLLMAALPLACISEYSVAENFEGTFVVIDGILKPSTTNFEVDSSDFKIKLSITTVSGSKSSTFQAPIKNAKVELVVNQSNIIPLTEVSNGTYFLKDKSLLQKSGTYQLRFAIGEKKYESSIEILPDTVAIAKLYTEFTKSSYQTYRIFVDVNDAKNVKNYYNWTTNVWEKQEFCKQCYTAGKTRTCTLEDIYPLPTAQINVSVNCNGNCWDIVRNKTLNSIADVFFDGNILLKKEVGVVPFNFSRGCLVEVQQMSLTPSYYQYLELLKNQTSGAGGLVDTPPAILVGNVKNVNDPTEKVIGFFSVANTVKRRFWLDRKEAKSASLQPLSEINPSVPPPVGSNIALEPCQPSDKRTNKKPVGWVE